MRVRTHLSATGAIEVLVTAHELIQTVQRRKGNTDQELYEGTISHFMFGGNVERVMIAPDRK